MIFECFLRIFQPFSFRVRGNQIFLPANEKYIISNDHIPVLDKEIIHSKNKLGFRGVNLPDNFKAQYSIFFVGGSTTECYYLSDGQDWPAKVFDQLQRHYNNIFANNAGLDGHSTFGHKILLQDHIIKLKPDLIVFLIGINDIGRDDLGIYDKPNIPTELNWKGKLLENIETVQLLCNMNRVHKANKMVIGGHDYVDVKTLRELRLTSGYMDSIVASHNKYLGPYKGRINELISMCRSNGIIPVFCTQPLLWGNAIDSVTAVDLKYAKVGDNVNGELIWRICEAYNDVLRETCADNDVLLIDLSRKTPKNSLYYYDGRHFTAIGASKIAEIVFNELTLNNKKLGLDSFQKTGE